MFSLPFEPVLDPCLWSPSALKLTLSDSTTCYSFLLQTSANSVTSPNLLKDFITCLSVTLKFLFCGYSWWFDYSHRHPFPVLGLSVSWLLLLHRSCLFSHISHPLSCHIISDASTLHHLNFRCVISEPNFILFPILCFWFTTSNNSPVLSRPTVHCSCHPFVSLSFLMLWLPSHTAQIPWFIIEIISLHILSTSSPHCLLPHLSGKHHSGGIGTWR